MVERILVVHAEPAVWQLVEVCLEPFDCEVLGVVSVAEAVRLAGAQRVGLVLTDFFGPPYDGLPLESIAPLRQLPGPPVLAALTVRAAAARVRPADLDLADIFVLPFHPQEFAARVLTLLVASEDTRALL